MYIHLRLEGILLICPGHILVQIHTVHLVDCQVVCHVEGLDASNRRGEALCGAIEEMVDGWDRVDVDSSNGTKGEDGVLVEDGFAGAVISVDISI